MTTRHSRRKHSCRLLSPKSQVVTFEGKLVLKSLVEYAEHAALKLHSQTSRIKKEKCGKILLNWLETETVDCDHGGMSLLVGARLIMLGAHLIMLGAVAVRNFSSFVLESERSEISNYCKERIRKVPCVPCVIARIVLGITLGSWVLGVLVSAYQRAASFRECHKWTLTLPVRRNQLMYSTTALRIKLIRCAAIQTLPALGA